MYLYELPELPARAQVPHPKRDRMAAAFGDLLLWSWYSPLVVCGTSIGFCKRKTDLLVVVYHSCNRVSYPNQLAAKDSSIIFRDIGHNYCHPASERPIPRSRAQHNEYRPDYDP